MRVKRNVYTRNTYEFSLSYQYGFLEPMDVVYVTTASQWAAADNPLGLVSLPIRLTKRVDNPDGTIDFTAEDYPFGIHQPVFYNKQLAAGVSAPNLYAEPGNSEVVIFEATNRLTKYQGNQIWIGATGANADWGSCNVYASMDQDTYRLIGSINTPARLGVLGAAFPLGSDPDKTNSLVVNLVANSAMLESATTADADADNTLTFVDGELVSYSTAPVTGLDQVTASGYIRRGRMGSTAASHAAGGSVVRLDDSIFKYSYDPSWAGATIFLKFQSVNVYGNAAQPLSSLSAIPFTIPGKNPGTIDASSGLIIGFTSSSLPPNIASNNGNNCQLVTGWDTNSNAAGLVGYGPGGPGTSWTFFAGSYSNSYPAFAIGDLQPSTIYGIVYDTRSGLVGALTQFALIIQDFYVLIGYVTTPSASTSGTNGGGGATSGGGISGGGNGCTVEGVPLDTPTGPVDNRLIKAWLDAGETVVLQGRYGPERIVSAEWLPVEDVVHVKAQGHRGFHCSKSHMLRVKGHYVFAGDIPPGPCSLETRDGYVPAWVTPVSRAARVLRIHLEGPSHEYSVRGVMTHNYKPSSLAPSK